MKTIILILLIVPFHTFSQYEYAPNEEFPYGRPNPNAPQQITDFDQLIGSCNCTSTTRNQDNSWTEPENMIWTWKYIMNGMAVQDETLKSDGSHSGSIRQFIGDSSRWYVHYYSSKTRSTKLPTWEGNKKENGNIVLYRDQAAPNGTEGFFRLTFYDINKSGYKWIGEWVDRTETVVFPTWKIDCKREK
ncbi:hypothetical protein C1T31_07960 [Hanstruepera neustonica]|uniref:Uncharacterized protein n=1 Tax=Hanstruepera neustonica TaxID=1445657 RepID=A0A2K1DZM0_9FLAO|nr:hypothetical protein [Hanstruepera neustonica]PNQ73478.1 hypothetical protein C1T31_07960 [Hanstruepera neustonica]